MGAPLILIVEDQSRVAKALALLLDLHGLTSVVAEGPIEALAVANEREVALVLQDMNFSPGAADGNEGVELYRQLRSVLPDVPILLLTAWGSIEHAVRLMRDGASDYIEKPWDDEKLIERISELIGRRGTQGADRVRDERQRLGTQYDLSGLTYASAAMHRVILLALKIAKADVPVLITGPNGSGKERVAELVQRNSARRDAPYIQVNVGALPDSLLEAELFGSEAGAFTGAAKRRAGRFEAAHGGTLLLDEIGNLSPDGQAKLLRVLQTGQFERLGSSATQQTDVRILAATNSDLPAAIGRGDFREDLYFRLNVIELAVPPLSARRADILPLAELFVRQLTPRGQGPLRLGEPARRSLLEHPWPGNVRELRNAVQRAVLVASGQVLQPSDLGLSRDLPAGKGHSPALSEPPIGADPPATEDVEERLETEAALLEAGGVVAHAAERLGISRQALYRRMQRLKVVLERRPRRKDS